MRCVWRAAIASLCIFAVPAAPALPETFRWASDADLLSLDPYASQATFQASFLANIYEPLVARDESLRLVPALATEWKAVAADAWRFTLRRGVRFADGSPFSADDVVFSFARVRA